VNERLLHDSRRVSDRVLELRALTRLACDYLERGDAARSDATIATRAELADSIGHPRYRWQTPLLRSMRAMPHGLFDHCEAHILEARRIAAESPDPNAERCIEFHRVSMLMVAGRPDALPAQEANAQKTLLSIVGNGDLEGWLTAVAATRLGGEHSAAALRAIKTTQIMARMERVTIIEAAVLVGVREVYERLYPSFDASEDGNACWGPFAFACLPPIARVLAMAAFALGKRDEALRHCERALALSNRMGADAHRAWVHLAWGEGTGAREHLDQALELAEQLGMPQVVERARAATERVSPLPSEARPGAGSTSAPREPIAAGARFTLRRDNDRSEWTVEHAGRSFRLKDVRGLGMLAQLVEQPGREIHALDLASESDGGVAGQAVDLGDAGEVIDRRARDAYKQRIAELRDELEEAESWSDSARAARIRGELDALTQQIAAAVGLGGRERRSGSATERARTAVQRRIREAIKKILEQDSELGRHLDWAVRTGTFCAYEPEGKKSGR
jgi:tetratricopeptide (TPR) repeat protein